MRILLSFFLALVLSCLAARAEGPYTGFFPDPTSSGDGAATYLTLTTSGILTNERVLSPTARFTITDNGPGNTYVLELATVPIAFGGSGQTTAQAGFNAFADGTAGAAAANQDMLVRGSPNWARLAVGADGTFLGVVAGAVTWTTAPAGAPTGASYLTLGLDAGLSAERVAAAGSGIGFADTGANGTLTIAVDSTVVRTTGAQSIGGVKTFTDSPAIANTKVLTLKGAAFDISIDGADVAAARLYSVPDVGTDADFIMSQGAQTKTGALTLATQPVVSGATISIGGNVMTFPGSAQTIVGQTVAETLTNKTLASGTIFANAGNFVLKQSSGDYTVDWANPAAGRAYSVRDVGTTAHFAMTSTAMAYTNGGVMMGNGNVAIMTAAGTSGQPFVSSGTTAAFAASLGQGFGGTGVTTYTAGDILTVNDAGTVVKLAVGTNGQILTVDTTGNPDIKWATSSAGTVTSFSATPSGIFDVATATTTPALSLDNQNANTVLAGPTSGGAATPSFRVLDGRDLPVFQSSDQTITAGGSLTIAHSLGYTPKECWVSLVCQTGEHGYSANDILIEPFEFGADATNNTGCAIVPDGTNLNVRYGSNANVFLILVKNTGAIQVTTLANWKARFYAR